MRMLTGILAGDSKASIAGVRKRKGLEWLIGLIKRETDWMCCVCPGDVARSRRDQRLRSSYIVQGCSNVAQFDGSTGIRSISYYAQQPRFHWLDSTSPPALILLHMRLPISDIALHHGQIPGWQASTSTRCTSTPMRVRHLQGREQRGRVIVRPLKCVDSAGDRTNGRNRAPSVNHF